jgi:hypothetical protein
VTVPVHRRSALAAAAVNATKPGANLTQMMATLDTQFEMYAAAFDDDEGLKELYLSVIGFSNKSAGTPLAGNTTPAAGAAAGHGVNWRGTYTAGG